MQPSIEPARPGRELGEHHDAVAARRVGPSGVIARLAFFAFAAPAVLRATWRLVTLERRYELDELASRLRDVPPFGFAALRRPAWLLGTVERLLPLLPPWRYGVCLRRSLLLLDLWSRCGLEPRLHLGVRRGDEGRYGGHAWVTAVDPAGRLFATSAAGYPEAFEL